MDEQFSDSDYRRFDGSEQPLEGAEVPPPGHREQGSEVPSRYKTTSAEKQARSQARAEARRTRRTKRIQQQAEQDQHYKLSNSDSSDESSIDADFDVVSITESENENLT